MLSFFLQTFKFSCKGVVNWHQSCRLGSRWRRTLCFSPVHVLEAFLQTLMCEECSTNLFLLILSYYLGLETKLAKQHKNHLCLLSVCKAMLKLNMPNVLQVTCETTVPSVCG